MTTNLEAPRYLVSRDTDLVKLHRIWEQVKKEGVPNYIFLLGEPGIGKTTLCTAFLAQLRKQKDAPLIAAVRCRNNSDGYEPIQDIFMQLFEAGKGVGLSGMELAQAIIKQAPAWISILAGHPVFAIISSVAEGMKSAYEHVLQQNRIFEQASIQRQFSRFLQTVVERRRLVVFIDDLHNADSSTLSLIESLPHSLDQGSILFLFASRYSAWSFGSGADPTHNERLKYVIASAGLKGAHKVELSKGLDIQQYIQAKYPRLIVPGSLLKQLIQKTEGHPLFVEKLLELWQQNGVIENVSNEADHPAWRFSAPVDRIAIPEALNDLVEVQLMSLAEDLRRLLQVAAIEGENFTVQVLSALLSEKSKEIIEKIQVIKDQHRLVKVYESLHFGKVVFDFYSFFHGFIYEYIYEKKLDPIFKRNLHKQTADILENLYAEPDRGPVATQLARHFREGKDDEKALAYYLIAAKYEQARYAWEASQRLCEEGISIAASMPGQADLQTIALLEISVQGYNAVGNYTKVIEQYEKAIARAIQAKDAPEHIAMMCQDLSDYLDTQGQLQKARQYIDLGLKSLGPGMERSIVRLYLDARLARLLSHKKGKSREATAALKSVIEKAEDLPASVAGDRLLYETFNYLGPMLFVVGALEEGKAAFRRSAELALKVGMPQDSRTALQNLAYNIIVQGEFQESLEIAERCLQDGIEAGAFEDQAYSHVIIGSARAGLGDYSAAIESLKKGIAMFEELGNTWNDPYSYYDLASAYLGAGDRQKALEAAHTCLLRAESASNEFDVYERALAYEVLGRAQATISDWEQAEISFEETIRILQGEGASFERARAQKFYGIALAEKGDIARGVKLLRSSLTTMRRLKMSYEANLISYALSSIQL